MEPADWKRVRELLEGALERTGDERERFLRAGCGDDAALRAEVDDLLRQEGAAELEPPPGIALAPLFDHELGAEVLGTRAGAYRLRQRIATGGMGSVYLAERDDEHFEKAVAVKLIRPGMDSEDLLRRFQVERQVLARLEHPGIARLIDGGRTENGRPFLVMEYVRGTAIDRHCDDHRLSTSERVELVREVCEAVQYAHRNLVVHRDLKPNNILVTAEGRPKLLDFGIAKLLDPDRAEAVTRLSLASSQPMTPDYASPEQVRGGPITTASDVWSLGVVLYELLAGRRPFRRGARSRTEIERAVCEEDPDPPSAVVLRPLEVEEPDGARRALTPEELARRRRSDPRAWRQSLRGDLDRIVLQALDKSPQRRYASAAQLAEDLERWLQGLPVLAHPGTRFYRARKFARRNRVALATVAAVFLALAAGFGAATVSWLRASGLAGRLAREQALVGEQNARLEEQQASILRLADLTRVEDLEARAARPLPAWPERLSELVAWREQGGELAARLPLHRATLWRRRLALAESTGSAGDDLRALVQGLERAAAGDGAAAPGAAELAPHEPPGGWRFATAEEQWQHDTLAMLIARLEAFTSAEPPGARARNAAAIANAELVERARAEHEDAWTACIARIADPDERPAYGGLALALQPGLQPLGADPTSGLEEFADLQSGRAPTREGDGELALLEESAVVFVLLPGGVFSMGSQSLSPHEAGYDRFALASEQPVHKVALEPFLVAKHELTLPQWWRIAGDDPSEYHRSPTFEPAPGPFLHPVDNLSWSRCREVLARYGWELPTEAQWEYAARAGAEAGWFCGPEPECLEHAGNIADLRLRRRDGLPGWTYADWEDGFSLPAPIGSYLPNAFGLHDVHGNVHEWCLDSIAPYTRPPRPRDGLRADEAGANRILRGGSFNGTPNDARLAYRLAIQPGGYFHGTGVRPARALRR